MVNHSDQYCHREPQRRADRHHGLHRQRPRRDGGCGLRLRRRRAGKGESLPRQKAVEVQYPEADEVNCLVDLIKENGRWFEAQANAAVAEAASVD